MRESFHEDSRIEEIQRRIQELYTMGPITYEVTNGSIQPVINQRIQYEIQMLDEMLNSILENEYNNMMNKPLPSLIELVKRPIINQWADFKWQSKMTEDELERWKNEQYEDFDKMYLNESIYTGDNLMRRIVERDRSYCALEERYLEDKLKQESANLFNRCRR